MHGDVNKVGGANVSGRVFKLRGEGLAVEDVTRIARGTDRVVIDPDPGVAQRVKDAYDFVQETAKSGKPLYGVTSAFGGMASVSIKPDDTAELQNNIIWYHKTGTGPLLPIEDVRAAMLLRANTLLRGASGVRFEIIQRLMTFLEQGVTPHVHSMGSIGASGDLVPLTYIAGSVFGIDECFKVDFRGETVTAPEALKRLGLPRLSVQPKEGLALINGTAVMTGIASICVHRVRVLLDLCFGAHALMLQAMRGTNQSFSPFITMHKPHPGQALSAKRMVALLDGSGMSRDELDGRMLDRGGSLLQDRYSMRCLPQYMGPIVDGLEQIERQMDVEINSAADNPLVDTANRAFFHCGNFLGEYVGVAMDQLRHYVGLLAKHLDAQIALVVAPEFNQGLPACLIGNGERTVNMGFKGLQIVGNSVMPLLQFYGNSIADRYPTHAEQFNQNINSQGFNAAVLARTSLDIFTQYVAISLMFGIQAVDLRSRELSGSCDARTSLSPRTAKLYEAIRKVVGVEPKRDRPYVLDDDEQALDEHIAKLTADINADGYVPNAIAELRDAVR